MNSLLGSMKGVYCMDKFGSIIILINRLALFNEGD